MTPGPSLTETTAPSPRYRADLPDDLAGASDEPTTPLDLDAFEQCAKTGEGDPWTGGE